MEHKDIPDADCHEPLHIRAATPADSGKVITPSATTSGASELRRLTSADLDGGISMDNVNGGAAVTGDAGKVYTPSAAVNGELELRPLAISEVTGVPAAIQAEVNTMVTAITTIATADAVDPATTMALVNEIKAKLNDLITALKA